MSSKYTNEEKQIVLINGLDKKVACIKRAFYYESVKKPLCDFETGEVMEYYEINKWRDYESTMKSKYCDIDCAIRLNESKYRRAKRVRDKIEKIILTNNAVFLTLTFTDETLAKTSAITRRRYVARYLKENACNYVANIDFGGLNGREHYHAVVDKTIDYNKWHDYGAIKGEIIRSQDKDLSRVSKYVSKLTNHALKVKGETPRLIYSRDTI